MGILRVIIFFDQKGSIFIPHYVRDKNTPILISNKLEKSKNPAKNIMTL